MSNNPTTAQFFDLELFRGKPLSEHLIYVRQQIAAILGSDLEFDDRMRVELETLESALGAYINRAKKNEIMAQNTPPLVSWKHLMGKRHLPDDETTIVWSRT
jgi:hypothetical protein